MKAVAFHGRNGFGDAIYIRAIVRTAAERNVVYLATAWPELFEDLPVRCVRPTTGLRGPRRNQARYPESLWHTLPPGLASRSLKYAWKKLAGMGILGQLEGLSGVRLSPVRLDLPKLPKPPVAGPRLAVIRPTTQRADWPCPARNPRPDYIVRAGEMLIEAGYKVVSVADILPGAEEADGPLPPAHQRFDHAELLPLELLSLVLSANVVVGGPGWIVPACLATGAPLLVVAGGRGGCDAPECLVDPRLRNRAVQWITPDRYCRCTRKRHACPKEITGFEAQFTRALETLTLGRAVA